MIEDNFRHKGMRRRLLEVVRSKGIRDERVLEAMNKIPRHAFMDDAFLTHAYEDKAFPIASGQTISQPYTVAFQTELLQVERGMKVLEIGTGSGYQCSVLCEIGAKVFSVERQKELYKRSKLILDKLGYRPKLFYGDGYKGLPAFAPFDRIIVTCGAPHIPDDLKEQLKVGGRMVIPVGGESQTMLLVEKKGEEDIEISEHGKFMFVPMLEDRNNEG